MTPSELANACKIKGDKVRVIYPAPDEQYGPEDDTWETERELRRHANDLVDTYEASNGPEVGVAREPEPSRHRYNVSSSF